VFYLESTEIPLWVNFQDSFGAMHRKGTEVATKKNIYVPCFPVVVVVAKQLQLQLEAGKQSTY